MTVEIFRIHDNNKLYFNVTEWLASSGGTKFSKSIEERSKEKLNFCLTFFYTSPRKKKGTHYKRLSMKSIRAAIDRFLCSPPLKKPFCISIIQG